MDSILCMCLTKYGFHTGQANSRIGRTKAIKARKGGVVTFNIRIFENCKAYFNFPSHTTSILRLMNLQRLGAAIHRGIMYGCYLTGFKNCELPGGGSPRHKPGVIITVGAVGTAGQGHFLSRSTLSLLQEQTPFQLQCLHTV